LKDQDAECLFSISVDQDVGFVCCLVGKHAESEALLMNHVADYCQYFE